MAIFATGETGHGGHSVAASAIHAPPITGSVKTSGQCAEVLAFAVNDDRVPRNRKRAAILAGLLRAA
jgi:hypothetical protein